LAGGATLCGFYEVDLTRRAKHRHDVTMAAVQFAEPYPSALRVDLFVYDPREKTIETFPPSRTAVLCLFRV